MAGRDEDAGSAAGRVRQAIEMLLRELLDGAPESGAYVLNRGDRGLLASLDGLSAEGASIQPGGRPSVASHVDHLRYGFSLLNRWAAGGDPWNDANYAASWTRQEVTDDQWASLRQALAAEAHAWAAECAAPRRAWDTEALLGAIGSVAHLAYHMGAIRQVAQSTSGPPARD
jgi:hypothetical protein